MSMNPVVHFEMPFEDRERMAGFYSKAFGWKPQMLGPEMGSYVVMNTTELDEKTKFPKEPGRINGGFFKKSSENQYPSVVIAVEDIREAMQRVTDAGGTVIGGLKPGEPDETPGIGLYISFADSEGNRVSMLQPSPIMDAQSNQG
jgi:predicted enzyme related to lactoylglutathione lyase